MIVARLVPVLEAFTAKGIGVLLIVAQFTHIALRIAHHAYVMERGRICFSGAPEALLKNPYNLPAPISLDEGMAMSGRFAGRGILVTGAGSGIGRAAAQLFANEGGRVVVDQDESEAQATVTSIRQAGGEGAGDRRRR